ncbi:MAG: hypothetical protein ABJP90_01115 [Paracoccaceae bacterium]
MIAVIGAAVSERNLAIRGPQHAIWATGRVVKLIPKHQGCID